MCSLDKLFANDRFCADQRRSQDPAYFTHPTRQRSPIRLDRLLDRRLPANEILGLDPDEAFVHRNIDSLVDAVYEELLQAVA